MTPPLQTVFDNGGSLDSLLTYPTGNEEGVDEEEDADDNYGWSTEARHSGTSTLGNLVPSTKLKKAFASELPLHQHTAKILK